MDKDSQSSVPRAPILEALRLPLSALCAVPNRYFLSAALVQLRRLIGTTHHQGKAIGGALTSGGKRRYYRGVVVFSGTLSMRRDRVAAAAWRAG